GLIAGYHALQAGIEVVGLCEALPDCSGYKVHKDKLARLGVPIYTSHTVLNANGEREVESVTIARINENWRPIPGTEKTFKCDTVLVAVGLDPVDEFIHKAQEFGLPVFAVGDAEEIAEASAAMFTGRIRGLEIARSLGRDVGEIPQEWYTTAEILKSRPGAVVTEDIPEIEEGVFPVLHCAQEIPCNPCTSVCPQELHPHRGGMTSGACRSTWGRAAPAVPNASPCARGWRSRWWTTARTPSTPRSRSPTNSPPTPSTRGTW
ncbi:MAG: hypothetical protein KAX26_16450, partial [Anaerolineae bacterium]|nr:hypothetical protein [Anaerolineae bacterium]